MKFSTREDIALPAADVFDGICTFEDFERLAEQRGAEVERKSEPPLRRVGSCWHVAFELRGKRRNVTLEVTELAAPEVLTLDLYSRNMTGQVTCELIPLSRSRTRLVAGIELRPTTISARLLLQSLKLVKSSVIERFRARVAAFGRRLETKARNRGV